MGRIDSTRKGFPLSMQRRDFLKYLAGGLTALWAVAITLPVFRYLKRPQDKESVIQDLVVAAQDEVQPGQSKTFKFGKRPGLLVRDKAGKYFAFDATCTHLGCIAQFRPEQRDIYCGCHAGIYSIDGKNVSGPPPRPLAPLLVKTDAKGNITVSPNAEGNTDRG